MDGNKPFYFVLAASYCLLFISYGGKMRKTSTPIQYFILFTTAIGVLMSLVKWYDQYLSDDYDNAKDWFFVFTGTVLGALLRTLTICLLVMTSLGWGAIRDEIDEQLKKLEIIGAFYFVFCSAMSVFQLFSFDAENSLLKFLVILPVGISCLEVFFLFWIMDALQETTQTLEKKGEHMELKRFFRLRALLYTFLACSFTLVVAELLERKTETFIGIDIRKAWTIMLFLVLAATSILWKPEQENFSYSKAIEDEEMANLADRIDGEEDDILI